MFEPIQSLVELPHFIGMLGVSKTRALANVDVPIDITIQKSRADVQGVNMIAALNVGRDGQQQPEASRVHNGIICLREIDSILLRVALGDKPGLVLDQMPISVKLLRKYPPIVPITFAPGRSVRV